MFYGYKEKRKPVDDRDFLRKPDVKFYELDKFECIIPSFNIKELKELEKDHPGFKDRFNRFKEIKAKQHPTRFMKPGCSNKCSDIGRNVNDNDTIETSSKQQNEDKIDEDKEEVVHLEEKVALKATKEGALERISTGSKEVSKVVISQITAEIIASVEERIIATKVAKEVLEEILTSVEERIVATEVAEEALEEIITAATRSETSEEEASAEIDMQEIAPLSIEITNVKGNEPKLNKVVRLQEDENDENNNEPNNKLHVEESKEEVYGKYST
jgi:signal recognition particle GTPase